MPKKRTENYDIGTFVTSRNGVGACFSVIYDTKRAMTNTQLNRCFVYEVVRFLFIIPWIW